MFFPYKDDNPRILIPYVTYGIIAVNVFIFAFQFSVEFSDPKSAALFIYNFVFDWRIRWNQPKIINK
jgi:membrane associated rhomboid family serine protease